MPRAKNRPFTLTRFDVSYDGPPPRQIVAHALITIEGSPQGNHRHIYHRMSLFVAKRLLQQLQDAITKAEQP